MILTVTLVGAACCFACGSDQKTTNTADNPPPADTSSALPDAATTPAPNGEPNNMPPSSPPPQSLSDANTGNAAAMPQPPSAMVEPTRLSENQIVMITQLANGGEIDQAKLAQNKAKSPAVKKLAAMMLKEHTEAQAEQAKLYRKLNLAAVQSGDANNLKDDADKTLGSLRAADGDAFDVAYVNAQVDEHQKLLDAIDKKLLPGATEQELIDGLNKMRNTVDAHLKHAQSLQAQLVNRQPVSGAML
jgi:putative membrane protein